MQRLAITTWILTVLVGGLLVAPAVDSPTEVNAPNAAAGPRADFAAGPEDPVPPVLFFYYGWHSGGKDGRHWAHGITDEPQAGYYDNHDLDATLHQFRTIREAGGTGIILSWWGKGSFEDESLRVAVEAGEKTGVKVTASFEAWNDPFRWSGSDVKVEQLEYIWHEYAQSDAWLRTEDGTPVLFVHAAGLREAEHWARVFEKLEEKGIEYHAYAEIRNAEQAEKMAPIFDGMYFYMPIELADDGVLPNANREMDQIALKHDSEWLPTVPPAYDNRNDSIRRFTIHVDWQDGKLIREGWKSAMELQPRFILLATWNEWNEGTTYEPGVEEGGERLRVVQELMREARGGGAT